MTELIVAMVIVGILVLLALPKLTSMVTTAKSTEAQLQLAHLHMLQKTYFYTHSKYSNDLDEIGFEHSKLITEDGDARYQIEIAEAGQTHFLATATAIEDFDGDGVYNVWHIDHDKKLEEVIKD